MICVIATIKTKAGGREALLEHIADNLPNVHAEDRKSTRLNSSH
jgi:quinol monooxygenase YgiN